ncbi:competence protein ComA [Streptococcus infantis]|uniref:competence protein ComA n=1 Tax=Streptococcus infantis TaxID=68892 RepID=UPI0039C2C994
MVTLDYGISKEESSNTKKITYDIIKQPSLSNRLELKTHVLVENHIDDLIYLHIIANNKLLDMVILHPFQKKIIFIPCYFEEDILISLIKGGTVLW